ncbi:hypothetical protein ElyMa_006293700 [Elysia marginata]|uniref:ShKT domain-containing protein n=1 Tax=Elysia marginata TaxID=1093978 RepID=A0AAV4HEK7_9GAST|nr:hypothetical protein ElyMa_006293700 [Elysia marginata]
MLRLMVVLSLLLTYDATDIPGDDGYTPGDPVIGDLPPDIYACRDEAMVCDFLVMHEPGFCTLEEHQAYVRSACRLTCGYCHILPNSSKDFFIASFFLYIFPLFHQFDGMLANIRLIGCFLIVSTLCWSV